jgi:hypothetical protein
MHWLLDVEFKDDLSRYRSGHGAKNMPIVLSTTKDNHADHIDRSPLYL